MGDERVTEGEDREKGAKNLFEEIAEKFLEVQEAKTATKEVHTKTWLKCQKFKRES